MWNFGCCTGCGDRNVAKTGPWYARRRVYAYCFVCMVKHNILPREVEASRGSDGDDSRTSETEEGSV